MRCTIFGMCACPLHALCEQKTGARPLPRVPKEASFVIEKRCTLDLLACAASLAAIYAIYAAGTVCLYAMWWPPARAPSAHTA